MNIQWQARTFHSFGGDGSENIIIYDVPFNGDFGSLTTYHIDEKIENGRAIWIYQANSTTLRVAVKFD
jgi:hypothetical protein